MIGGIPKDNLERRITIPFDGQWMPNENPEKIGAKNFTVLKNMRPTYRTYETIDGGSTINTNSIIDSNDTGENLHHFSKTGESHVIAKISNGGSHYLYQNTTAIPGTGDFSGTSLYTVGSGAGSFANAPKGVMFYMDSSYSLVWGGNELDAGGLFVGDSVSAVIDYTDKVNNSLTDELAYLGAGGIDSYAVLMLHCNGADASTTFTDDGDTGHTVTANGDAQIDTDFPFFGSGSGMFDGTGDYLSVPDHADWNFGSGALTIDGRVKFNTVSGQHALYSQSTGTSYVVLLQDHDQGIISFYAMSASVSVSRKTASWTPVAGTWYHWAVVRGWGGGANSWAVTIDGTAIATWTDSGTLPDVGAALWIGTHSPTVIIDSSNLGHAFTTTGNATVSSAQKKFGNGSIYFDGTGDRLSSVQDSDFDSLSNYPLTIEAWVKHTDHVGQELYIGQYGDANNFWAFQHTHGTGVQFKVVYLATTYQTLAGGEITDTNWHHVMVVASASGVWGLYVDGAQVDYYSGSESGHTFNQPLHVADFSGGSIPFDGYIDELRVIKSNPYGASPDAGLTDTITVPTAAPSSDSNTVLLLHGDAYPIDGWLDEYRVSKGIARWTANFTPSTRAYSTGASYYYVTSPYKLNGIKVYVQDANQETSTLTGTVWTGAGWSSLTLTDNTASGGVTHAQTGTVTWSYTDDPKILYINGVTQYVYRFALSAGSASVYKITVSAPLQPVRDIWNEAPRTCISFQASRSGVYEDYTFSVADKDSTADTQYAATIGGLVNTDFIIVMFDDRSMGINFTMISSFVNAADAQISDIQYWDGEQYTSAGYFNDGTLDTAGDSSFAQSGVLSWNPPDSSLEQSQELFGVRGYAYKIKIDGTLTDGTSHNGTSIDLVTGITAPLDMTGYNAVDVYSRRVMLIKGSKIDFSQTSTPWVFNGVDSSDDGRLSISTNDDNPIIITIPIYNRYGSSLVEGLVILKNNSTELLLGRQPYSTLPDSFDIKVVSDSIGCPAPLTVQSYEMEIEVGLKMRLAVWLDYAGPVIFNGATVTRLQGVENFFDPSKSECINYSYISLATSYIDTVNDEWNIIFPSGSGATANNKWIVYSFRHKKWYEKTFATFPEVAAFVTDTNGARYNYGLITQGKMLRLDNGNVWVATAIDMTMTTGYFSPPLIDEYGFWTQSEITALRLASGLFSSNDVDVTAKIYYDGTLGGTLTIPLDQGSGVVSQNAVAGRNLNIVQGNYFQVQFTATNAGTEKWNPLVWGYKAKIVRED